MKNITFKGQIAFCVAMGREGDGANYILGVAEENEYGYRPYRGLSFDSWDAAQARADEMNERLGLSKRDAALIVASTMRGERSVRAQIRRDSSKRP